MTKVKVKPCFVYRAFPAVKIGECFTIRDIADNTVYRLVAPSKAVRVGTINRNNPKLFKRIKIDHDDIVFIGHDARVFLCDYEKNCIQQR